jgi:phosphatidylinositol-binding clathrin assembly protein
MASGALLTNPGHFFEMSKVDAERAMEIYRNFTKQTDFVVQYLSVARQYEHHTRVEVPKLKHAPVNLGRQLEEYLGDPDFEVNRRQYLAELDVKKSKGGPGAKASRSESVSRPAAASNNPFPSVNGSNQAAKSQVTKGPDPDLIDFFDSIEQNQTQMQMNPQPQMGVQYTSNSPYQQVQPTGFQQQNGFVMQQQTGFIANSPFQQQNIGAYTQQQQAAQQLQPNFTGAGFGGFTPQPSFQPGSLAPIPQDTVATFQTGAAPGLQSLQTGQNTNPFRQSMLMNQASGMQQPNLVVAVPNSPTGNLNRQNTNPFARSMSSPQVTTAFSPTNSNSPFQSQSPQQMASPPAPLQPMATGTNPFARNFTGAAQPQVQLQQPQAAPQALAPQPTGSTNPFRQGPFVNHATGMGWQHNQAPIGGGLDQLGTVPVFPRPAHQSPWQQ